MTDLRAKEVINVSDGCRLGCVDDVEVDTCTAHLCAIVLHGRPKCFGLLGREEDLIIPWKEIEVIGEETILVNRPGQCFDPTPGEHKGKKKGLLGSLFG
ncbi:MAG: YlmC/YmxH family sporulation protein [Oscillospiraceae bacterium]|nr:YlmC/YmxH family sporulation protein [Oscillospiraceae bacterium]